MHFAYFFSTILIYILDYSCKKSKCSEPMKNFFLRNCEIFTKSTLFVHTLFITLDYYIGVLLVQVYSITLSIEYTVFHTLTGQLILAGTPKRINLYIN